MKTKLFYDQLISICHVLMNYENIHFNLSHSTKLKSSELVIYFGINDDASIKEVSDFISETYPYFNLVQISYSDCENPFKILRVEAV